MEELKYSILALAVGMTLSLISAAIFILKEVDKSKKEIQKTIQDQNEWLFNQLYSIAPGKVLRPEEKESETPKKAVVIHHSRDPMNEFNGKKYDWD